MNEHEKLRRARAQVKAITAFYVHFTLFLAVMAILFLIDLNSGSGWWMQWPLAGWGLGVALHALSVFGRVPGAIKEWQLRKIRAIKDTM